MVTGLEHTYLREGPVSILPPPTPDQNPDKTRRLRSISKVVVVLTAIIWGLYDILPSINAGRGDTISENLRDWARRTWCLPFFWGGLTAHLFVNIGQHPTKYRVLFFGFAGLTGAAIAANVVTALVLDWSAPLWFRVMVLAMGAVAGMLLWGQNA